MKERRWLVGAMVIAGLAGPAGRQAEACSPPPCSPTVQPPLDGGVVPANALVIPVLDSTIELTLVGPDGNVDLPLRADAGGGMFRAPAAMLTPGTYNLSYQERCSPGVTPAAMQRRVVVVGPSAYPTAIGSAELVSAGVRPPHFVFAQVSLTSDPTFVNFSGLAKLSPQIDDETASNLSSVMDGGRTVTVEVDCSADARPEVVRDSCGGISMVPPGTHKVTFSTSVVGAPVATILRTSVDVRLDCAWLRAIKPNATAAAAADTTDAPNSGCAVGGSGDGAPSGLGIGVVALVLGWSMKRRPRR